MECKDKKTAFSNFLNAGFNRYIVECKGELFIEICRTYSGFNRYIVECKEERDGSNDRSETDLIDTLWNVKLPGPGP